MDKDRTVNLLPHLLLAKETVFPLAHVGTIRRCFNLYAKYTVRFLRRLRDETKQKTHFMNRLVAP